MFGWGLRFAAHNIGGFAPSFNPLSLTPTVMFDMSDMTTLFQNSAGTTPVTAAGQPVGLMLDKSQGLVLGPELVTNGDFSAGLTGFTNSSTGTGTVVASGGGALLTGVDASNRATLGQPFATVAGKSYKVTYTASGVSGSIAAGLSVAPGYSFSITAKDAANGDNQFIFAAVGTTTYINFSSISSAASAIIDNISVKELPGNHASQPTAGKRPILGRHPFGGRRNLLNATDALATQSVTVTAAAHTLKFTGAGTVTLSGAHVAGPLSAGTHTFTPSAGSLTLTVSGSVTIAQLELGSTATPYQKVVSTYNVTEAGVPECWYLKTDGVDDGANTGNISLTGTDKVSVVAGLRKLDDGSRTIAEFGASTAATNNTFALGSSSLWLANARGTVTATASSAASTADTSVITSKVDLAAGTVTIRQDGVDGTPASGLAASGNFISAPLYLASRAGTTLFNNGNQYPYLLFPYLLDADQTAKVEAWVAAKTGVVLP